MTECQLCHLGQDDLKPVIMRSRWPNASWARIQWMSGLSWIAVTSNEVYGLLWSKWPVDHPWSRMTNVRAFTSVPASRETRHRSVSPQDLWDQEEAKGTWSFEIIKKCFSTSGEVRGLEWPSVGDLTPLPAPEEQDIFSEHKKLSFVSPQDLLRSGGGQGDKICWDQKLREMEKQIMQRNLPQSLKDNYDDTRWGNLHMNSYNLPSIKACNFLLLSFKTVVTRKIWEIYQVKDLALVLGNSRQMRFLNILNSMVFVTIENSASPPPTQILNSSEFT